MGTSSHLIPQFSDGNFNSPEHHAAAVANSSTPLHCGNFSSPQQPHNYLSSGKRHGVALQASDNKYTYGLPYEPQATTLRPSASPHCDLATSKCGFSFFESLQHSSDFDVSDLDLPMNLTSYVEARSHITRDVTQQSGASFNNLQAGCSSCQTPLMSLHKRLSSSSLEAEFAKLKRKQRKVSGFLSLEVQCMAKIHRNFLQIAPIIHKPKHCFQVHKNLGQLCNTWAYSQVTCLKCHILLNMNQHIFNRENEVTGKENPNEERFYGITKVSHLIYTFCILDGTLEINYECQVSYVYM